jgi:hypothetical protein
MRAGGRTDRQTRRTDMTKLTVAFRNLPTFLITPYVIHTAYRVVLRLVPVQYQPIDVCSGERLPVDAYPYTLCGY